MSESNRKKIVVIGGGTISHIRSHLALCAPAYGTAAKLIAKLCAEIIPDMDVDLQLTKMAGGDKVETSLDLADLIYKYVRDPATRVMFMSAAVCDFTGSIDGMRSKYAPRLRSRDVDQPLVFLKPVHKLIGSIRKTRKDIFLVGFKTTCQYDPARQYLEGLGLCKQASCNLVLANDVSTRLNMVVTPEESRYHETTNREEALRGLVEMVYHRSQMNFTRSTVVDGQPIPWVNALVPDALREVITFCINANAYKPFNGVTAGHFACKINDTEFLTSIRKTNFNELAKTGMVLIKTDKPDSVIAYGEKPSVGGQSQRIVFHDHPEMDCIVHFHCPLKEGSKVPVVSQREFECGSHQCGSNTSKGLATFGNLKAVYLDNHGPNIVFHRSIDPAEVIAFIQENFDLAKKTGGYVTPQPILENSNKEDS